MSKGLTPWPSWCCSYCGSPLTPRPHGLLCEAEERFFATRNGVHRLLPEDRLLEAEAFASHRRERLRAEGVRPGVGPPLEWDAAVRLAARHLGAGPWRVLEVGAGPCAASLDLLARGHRPVAVDVDIEAEQGLGAAAGRLPAGAALPRAQAEWDALPLEPGSADLIVLVRALHHAPLTRALIEMRRVTRKGGALLCVGSPVRRAGDPGDALPRESLAERFAGAGWGLHSEGAPFSARRLLAPRRSAAEGAILFALRQG